MTSVRDERFAHPAEETLLAFTRALRAAGVPISHDRARTYLAAVAAAGVGSRQAVRAAGRATLCGSPDDLARHDQVFATWFDADTPLPVSRPHRPGSPTTSSLPLAESDDPPDGATGDDDPEVRAVQASDVEILRHLDVAALDAGQRARLAALLTQLRPRAPLRRTGRHQAWRRGGVDTRRTLRSTLRQFGEPGAVQYRRRGPRPRRVVLLVDVSGSMADYADVLLRLAHRVGQSLAAQGGRVETFTLGTRLTHLTRALRLRDPERALAAAGDAVPDWAGGTRLGENLAAFNDRWGRRGTARGAVVVIFSDGWERGDVEPLAEQLRRLRLVAHRVVWVNPHRGKPGYQPVQAGIRAALPHVDAFVAGHSLATYAELLEVLADA